MKPPVYDFSDQVVVVTGGASGIGFAVAKAFAEAAATVEIWDIQAQGIAIAKSRLDEQGLTAIFSEVDVTSAAKVDEAAQATLKQHSRVDVLINNAGMNIGDQRLSALTDQTLEAMLSVNLNGTINGMRSFAPAMVEAGTGAITNTASMLARMPLPVAAGYAASKAAVATITEAWSRELGPSGVRVNAVAPGVIDTPMNRDLPPKLKETLVARTPLRRLGLPEEVAAAHLFLASPAASFINGAIVPIDGGISY